MEMDIRDENIFHGGFRRIDNPDGSTEIVQSTMLGDTLKVGFRQFAEDAHIIKDRESIVLLKQGDNPNSVLASTIESLRSERGI